MISTFDIGLVLVGSGLLGYGVYLILDVVFTKKKIEEACNDE